MCKTTQSLSFSVCVSRSETKPDLNLCRETTEQRRKSRDEGREGGGEKADGRSREQQIHLRRAGGFCGITRRTERVSETQTDGRCSALMSAETKPGSHVSGLSDLKEGFWGLKSSETRSFPAQRRM